MENDGFKSGFITLVGRPNAGKSTLVNAILGKKVAITSNTPQTTRHRFSAVLTRPDCQLVFVDTPGIHKPHDVLGEELNESALQGLEGVDCCAFLVDASKPIGSGDEWVARHVAKAKGAKVGVLTKTDLVDSAQLEEQMRSLAGLGDWQQIVSVCAKDGTGVQELLDCVTALMPEGPLWFPADMDTDQPIEVLVAEFIREKILYRFRDEVPHAIGVVVEDMAYDAKRNLTEIYAFVYCERESQKGMIIGKGGSALKEVGTSARADLETLLGTRVFLDLRVKVRKNWRRDINQIRRFGYGQGI